jgi:AcrR family transcriptional regulator
MLVSNCRELDVWEADGDCGRGTMPPTASDASGSSELRERIMEAMLLTSGEVGYRGVTVEGVAARYGGDMDQFQRQFATLDDCFASAFDWQAERIAGEILAAGAAAPSWRQGLRQALDVLGAFVRARPLTARALLVEVYIAGEPSLSKRKEIFERLSRAIDSARREAAARHSPPPLTALFMISAIEAAVVSSLIAGKPEAFAEGAQDLGQMIFAAYFGDDPADDGP